LAKTYITIMGSVFITLILVDLSNYLEDEDLEGYVKFENLTEGGILLQSKLEMFNETANILSSQMTPIPIPGTNMSFTIQNNSKIALVFSVPTLITLTSSFSGYTGYYIILEIEGIGNASTMVTGSDNSGVIIIQRRYCDHIYLYFETDTLPAGTYQINTYYYSDYNAGSNSELELSPSPYENYPRSILAHELKTE